MLEKLLLAQILWTRHGKFERAIDFFNSLGFSQMFNFFLVLIIMYMNEKNGICKRIHFYLEWIVFYLYSKVVDDAGAVTKKKVSIQLRTEEI
jgi:hypothetical protein